MSKYTFFIFTCESTSIPREISKGWDSTYQMSWTELQNWEVKIPTTSVIYSNILIVPTNTKLIFIDWMSMNAVQRHTTTRDVLHKCHPENSSSNMSEITVLSNKKLRLYGKTKIIYHLLQVQAIIQTHKPARLFLTNINVKYNSIFSSR